MEYDAFDRTTRLVLDGEAVLAGDYGIGDIDIVEADDQRTSGVPTAAPVSPVFGTMDSIVYSRPRSAEFGLVAYSPTLKTFEFRLDALAPDAILLASMRARMALGGEPNTAPLGHDKPSSTLFVSPEFRSVNCQVCTGDLRQVWLTVRPFPVHCETLYNVVVDGHCGTVVIPHQNVPVSVGVKLPWLHTTDYGDGTSSGVVTTTSNHIDGTHRYHVAGPYEMSHFVLCSCPSVFVVGWDTDPFVIPDASLCPPPRCSLDFDIEPAAPAIPTVPAMPNVTASVDETTPSNATVSWTATISHTVPGSSCNGGPTFGSATPATGTGRSFTPAFDAIYGGQLTITATCSAPGHVSSSVSRTVTVNGTQPSVAAIAAQIGTVDSPFHSADLRRIACKESRLTQFRPSPGPPHTGTTKTPGKGGDIGIMQICEKRKAKHLWNWRENVAEGRTKLEAFKGRAKEWLEDMVKDGATPYTDEWWREEAIHRYNAGDGGSADAYREWRGGEWLVVKSGGHPGYLDEVLRERANCQ